MKLLSLTIVLVTSFFSLTQSTGGKCITTGGAQPGVPCVFPFIARGVTYTGCTKVGGYDKSWCSTKVDVKGDTVLGNWGDCPVIDQDCYPTSGTTPNQGNAECTSPIRMNLDIAHAAENAAIQKANQMGKKCCVTVLDTGVQLVTFARMDGAALGTIDVSMKKAKTSALFGVESSILGAISQPGGPAYGAEQTNGGLVGYGGGVPLKSGSGDMIGAIGVSGGSVAEDEEVARAAAEVIKQKY